MEEDNQTDMLDLDRRFVVLFFLPSNLFWWLVSYFTDNFHISNRRRQKPKRYSEKEFVEALSDNEADYDSDDDIVGEAVYDEEYLQKRKQRRKASSSSVSESDISYLR